MVRQIARPEATDLASLDRVWAALATVNDPEVPVVSVLDMGMIPNVTLEEGRVVVQMTPTFAGCPALDVIRNDIRSAVQSAGFEDVRVDVVFHSPWSTDRISAEGRRKLKEFGLAPPTGNCAGGVHESDLHNIACPHCNSCDTTLESIFGPTLCRAIHYCNKCQQSFEQFKPVE